MAIDLQMLEQRFNALLDDPNFVTDFEQWLEARNVSQNSSKPIVSSSDLPPVEEIENALNLAQAEIRAMYKPLGYNSSNVLDIVDRCLDDVKAAMPS